MSIFDGILKSLVDQYKTKAIFLIVLSTSVGALMLWGLDQAAIVRLQPVPTTADLCFIAFVLTGTGIILNVTYVVARAATGWLVRSITFFWIGAKINSLPPDQWECLASWITEGLEEVQRAKISTEPYSSLKKAGLLLREPRLVTGEHPGHFYFYSLPRRVEQYLRANADRFEWDVIEETTKTGKRFPPHTLRDW